MLDDIDKIKIGHDNSGSMAGWHLHSVNIEAPELRKNWHFPCGLWFDRKESDGQIERELVPNNGKDEKTFIGPYITILS